MKDVRRDGIVIILWFLKIMANSGRNVGDRLEEVNAAGRMAKYTAFFRP